jgi:two-component system sensor histidine kinase HydH
MFAVLSGLFFWVFRGEISRSRLLTQYQLEQALAQTMALIRTTSSGDDLAQATGDLPFILEGFALYDHTGTPLVVRGDAPDFVPIDLEAPREQLFQEDGSGESLTYIRRFPNRGLPPSRSLDKDFAGTPPPQPALLYLRAIPAHRLGYSFFTWPVYIIIEVLLAAALFWIGKIQLTNQRYRQTLENQRSLVTLGEASRTISHEIKNPLNAIRLRLKVLEKLTPEDAQQDIQVITQEVERLNRLSSKIRQLLVTPQGSPQTISLQEGLQNLVKNHPDALTLDSNMDGHITIDPDHLRSIIENLLVNAQEAGSPSPIRISLEHKRRIFRILVQDKGPGIDPNILPRLFSPFVTNKPQGSGLGLAISRQFAQAAGGDLTVSDTGNQGTTITLSLPEQP